MARPKSTRMKDKAPAIQSIEKVGKRKVFADDDEEQDEKEQDKEAENEPEQPVRSTRTRSMSQDSTSSAVKISAKAISTIPEGGEEEDDDDAPEVISSSSNSQEILRMQQLHELMSMSKKKSNKKKRKLKLVHDKDALEQDGDAELDVSIFEEVQQFEAAGGRQAQQQEEQHKEQVNQRVHFSSEEGAGQASSKKIGHVTVHLLPGAADEGRRPNASAALASFGRSAKAMDFMQQQEQNVPRTRFAQFAGQKSAGPAKKFRLN